MQQYSSPQPSEPQPQWTIDNVTDSFGPAGLSVPQRYKRVAYHTREGDSSYVEVPLAPGWPDEAVRQIQAHVDEIYALKAAQGPIG